MSTHRVSQQAVFVLHTRPYSESSLIVELFSQSYGRLAVLAKGARRVKTRVRGVLQPFQPLIASWSGKGELPILTDIEQGKIMHRFDYKSKVCGFYANELIYNLIQRRDPHPQLYQYFCKLFESLALGKQREQSLRLFEKQLLRELGYALILDREIDSQELINPDFYYQYIPEKGPVLYRAELDQKVGFYDAGFSPLLVSGRVLHSIDRNQYVDEQSMLQAKRFMRHILKLLLGNKNLYSRDLLYLS